MHGDTIIIGEVEEGKVLPVTYELVAFARELSPGPIAIIILGRDMASAAGEIAQRTGLEVIAVEHAFLDRYSSELWKDVLTEILPRYYPHYIVAAHTSLGQDYAPGLAVRLAACSITSVQGIVWEDGAPVFSRAIFNGKLLMDVRPEGITVLTVQPGAFRPEVSERTAPGPVTRISIQLAPQAIVPQGRSSSAEEDALPLTEAPVIISAGRGIGKQEHLDLVYQLAGLFAKAAVGGSRPVCDLGWLPYRSQVGMTGKTVTPKLYIACGISGTPQHVAGMKNSQLIVAINKDPHAAIFRIADYGIVEDLMVFIPLLLEEYEQSSLQ